MDKLWQITIASDERYRWFTTGEQRLAATRAIAATGRHEQVLFCVVDEHLHSVVHATRKRAGRIAANLSNSIGRVVDPPLQPARITKVKDRKHLENMVGYVLNQTEHHGIDAHPATWVSGCLADLVGARDLVGFEPNALFDLLPRWQLSKIWEEVGLTPPRRPTTEELEHLAIRELYLAAAASRGVSVGACGHVGCDIRAAAAQLAAQIGHDRVAIRRALDVGETTARRLLQRPLPQGTLDTLIRQLALRNATAGLRLSRAACQATAGTDPLTTRKLTPLATRRIPPLRSPFLG